MSTIILCGNCDGAGTKNWHKLPKWPGGIATEILDICSKCEGTGRLLMTTTTTYEPYFTKAVKHETE